MPNSNIYDYVFVTHLPAFYKVNLYNKLAEQLKIYVIFIGYGSNIRAKDFNSLDNKEIKFNYTIINNNSFENRNKLVSLYKIARLILNLNFKKIVLGGWDLPEFWLLWGITRPKKLCLSLESSIFESKFGLVKKSLKKLFLSRINLVFASGSPHKSLLDSLGFKGKVVKTLGVGLANFSIQQEPHQSLPKLFNGEFLCIARLSDEKNLEFLLKFFSLHPEYRLTLIGDGPLLAKLNQLKPDNVNLIPHVPNVKLGSYFQKASVFILPSLKEPWGLVIEEALFFNLPILVSSKVGSAIDLVVRPQTGLVFEPGSIKSLSSQTAYLINSYPLYSVNAGNFSLSQKDNTQTSVYCQTNSA